MDRIFFTLNTLYSISYWTIADAVSYNSNMIALMSLLYNATNSNQPASAWSNTSDFYLDEPQEHKCGTWWKKLHGGCGRTVQRQQWALWFARVCLAPHWSILTTTTSP